MAISLGEMTEKIKQKKELSGIDDSIVLEALNTYLDKNKLSLSILGKNEIKEVVKDIRAELRVYSGMFHLSVKKGLALLEENRIEEILKSHSSTRERIDFYPALKKEISSLNASSILDLGCGLNPIALASKETEYYASDINKGDLEIVEKYFEKNKIIGKTFVCDLRKIISCKLPNADVCLLFKVLDIIGKEQYILAEKILRSINCKYLVISFATRTLSGKPMAKKRRFWLENLLNELKFKFKIIESKNEMFYFVKRAI